MILARLAIDKDYQGRGLGKGLMKDALIRIHRAAGAAGIQALLVHAEDDWERSSYGRFGVEASKV
jgi:GNAT superfamily N-acetyltransferase